ncbi:hypothetical protein D3C86_2158290 [compost metagenome]
MQKELDNYLAAALKRLEKAYNEISKAQTYNTEAENVKLLTELVKEQIKNENSHPATR